MRFLIAFLATLTVAVPLHAQKEAPDERQQMRVAAEKIRPVMSKAEALALDGKIADSNALVKATFPEAQRTPVESLMLGNVLFKMDAKGAYALHKSAAAAMPNSANALLEWALEQHRAKEYAAALATYQAYLKLQPDHATAHGLAAECYIRTGDIDGAVKSWKTSETAQSGTIEQFETFVCEVNGSGSLEPERARLLGLVAKGDLDAAEALILLDTGWERDWWNNGPYQSRLKHDLPLVKALTDPAHRLAAALCVADAALEEDNESPDMKGVFTRHGFLLDKAATLPDNPRLMSRMLGIALSGRVMSEDRMLRDFGDRVLAKARASKDVEAYNAAARLFIKSSRQLEIDQEGWNETHDPRFAVSYLYGKQRAGGIKPDDPILVDALKRFPEHSQLMVLAVMVGDSAGQPLEPLLIAGIKAEFTRFSLAGGDLLVTRPRADAIRLYFSKLQTLRAKK